MTRTKKESITTPSAPHRSYEKFSATLLLVAGIIYFGLWLISIFSETSTLINVTDDKLSVKMSELLGHTRTFITILFSVLGGLLIFRKKRWGWILGATVLLLLLIICSGAVYQSIKLREPMLIVVAGIGWLILLISLLILFTETVRRKLDINKPAVVTAGLFSVFLILFYFFLQ